VALLVAAACIAIATTYRIVDTDFWQHLAVGRAIVQTHTLPHTNVWTWPTFGEPYVVPSWLYRVLLWPFWQIGGVAGLFVWRWLTTAATFAVLWVTARRMGAAGLTTLWVLVWCAMIYRQRSQLRPETFVSVLLVTQLLWLESWRRDGRDRTIGIVAIAWLWANAHVSYALGLALTLFYWLDERWRARRERRRPSHALLRALALSGAISFLHPYGWRALWQPFEFALFQRHELIYQTIDELRPIPWSLNLQNGLPLLLVLIVALWLWRWRRLGLDVAQTLTLATFLPQALLSFRFLGFFVLAATPFFARDLDLWVRARRWPAWTASPWRRAALACGACATLTISELAGSSLPVGFGIDWSRYPVRACDYLAAHDIRGPGFNTFPFGGYLLWRFWPDRGRLPFMDIHQTGTREDRDLYAIARLRADGWRELCRRHRFEWVLVPHEQFPGHHLLDFLDRDTTWALVSLDDAGVLYVRRDGPFAALAERERYRWLAASEGALAALGPRIQGSLVVRDSVRVELRRAKASSPWSATASSLLANLAMIDERWDEAERELTRAAAIEPRTPFVHERLGRIRLGQGRPQEALTEFRRERPRTAVVWMGIGRAERAIGDRAQARAAYEKAEALAPSLGAARDSLATLGGP